MNFQVGTVDKYAHGNTGDTGWSLVQEDPTCHRTEPVHRSCWTCAPQEKPPQWEAHTPQTERSPFLS